VVLGAHRASGTGGTALRIANGQVSKVARPLESTTSGLQVAIGVRDEVEAGSSVCGLDS